MLKMIRREALTRLAGTGAGVILSLAGNKTWASPSSSKEKDGGAILIQGTLNQTHMKGRSLIGFLETGISGGQTLCSLVRQDTRNPAVQSIFAMPIKQNNKFGIEVTITFFTEPVGDITFSLLHVKAPADTQIAMV